MGYFKELEIEEMETTQEAVTELVDASYEVYKSYAHGAGMLQVLVENLIHELPKARRAYYREQILRMAIEQKAKVCQI